MDNTDQNERLLIERAKADRQAFGELYELHVDRIYNYIYYRTGNSGDAEDLTARVFFRAIRHIGNYEDRGVPFSAWLYQIARNLLANWYRDQGRRKMIPLERIAQQQSPENPELAAERQEDNQALLLAIRRLPPDRQELLILKYVERLSNAEIGQILERSEGAIKSLYHRTLLSLRDDLQKTAARERTDRRRQSNGRRKDRRFILHWRPDKEIWEFDTE
jgi:RNA polymerase sigma-70 factor (ECF subfamily)